MSYEDESKILLDNFKKEEEIIIEKYKDEDKKYYKKYPQILDGRPPSYKELEKCRKKVKQDLKELKEKYNVGTK